MVFWDAVLEVTATPTSLQQDEYEDPREIKVLKVNRIKATQSRLASISHAPERLRQSVFGQLHSQLRTWSSSSFRRSYIGKGHGGQKRAFKVKFLGEGVNDYGGPYRALFEQVIDELQCDSLVVGRRTSERCLLPLLIPCCNRRIASGANQDKFLLTTAPATPMNQELMQFFGKLVGTAVRHDLNLGINFSALLWRALVRLPVSRAHLETVDETTVKLITDITKVGLELEGRSSPETIPEGWSDYTFCTYFPDGTRVELVPGGDEQPVNLGNWRDFIYLLERCRLQESAVAFKVFRDGLSSVLPVELLPLFTSNEIEQIISGNSSVDVAMLRQCTEYEDIQPDSEACTFFWRVLEEMSQDERTLFLRFVWARSRMPASAQDFPMNFKLQGAQGAARERPDDYLPSAQTCFFALTLPSYSSLEIMREKLLYAINNSPNMDADVRLHSAEGWND